MTSAFRVLVLVVARAWAAVQVGALVGVRVALCAVAAIGQLTTAGMAGGLLKIGCCDEGDKTRDEEKETFDKHSDVVCGVLLCDFVLR